MDFKIGLSEGGLNLYLEYIHLASFIYELKRWVDEEQLINSLSKFDLPI